MTFFYQAISDIVGFIALWKDSVTAFGNKWSVSRFKKFDGIFTRETVDCRVKEFRIRNNVFDEVVWQAVVGDVTSSFTGDE